MPHQPSVEALEEIEKHFQRLIDLLNQADQALQEVRSSNAAFERAHHMNAHKGDNIEEAITKIESVLAQANNLHNEGVGRLHEAKAEVAQRQDEASETESSEN
jgi:ABC-type transporter Mla subunit MlaD